ncbi:MAG: 2, 3-cyclic nucleotide 2-phosphodiesterase [Glaciihabitans sp.]|nr:2, 3-cyclic nucleotide 2-phosphodiesterase [Glaciihabitans sp.]
MSTNHQLSDTAITALASWFDDKGIITPSINFAVFDRDGILFHHSIGEFQRDGRAPEVNTIYRIASMSKSFCIASVLVLHERGLLALDDEVAQYVPEFRNYIDPFGVEIPITIRMLMSNSSGLPEDNAWADHHLAISRDDLLAHVAAGFRFADYPDAGYQYSNMGFALLGFIVENITGEGFTRFATHTLLEPLGLVNTHYSINEFPDRGEGGEGIAHGYTSFDKGASWVDRPVTPTGAFGSTMSMFSTLIDIQKWSAWLSSAFAPDNSDDSILSRASRRLMQRGFTSIHSTGKASRREHLENAAYGFGLMIEQDVRFGNIAHHSGGLPGWGSNMRWQTSSGLGVVLFTNTNGNTVADWTAAMLRLVLEDLDIPAKIVPLWPETVSAAQAIETAILNSAHVLDAATPFSPNVNSDVPAAVRDERLAALIAKIGGLAESTSVPPLAERLSWAIASSHVVWSIPGATGSLECRLEMSETKPSTVQRIDIAVANSSAAPLVVQHYVPQP